MGVGGYNQSENWALSIQQNLKLRKIPNGTVLSGCTVPTQVNTRLVRFGYCLTQHSSKFGHQLLVMVNYACAFSQSELGKYFE